MTTTTTTKPRPSVIPSWPKREGRATQPNILPAEVRRVQRRQYAKRKETPHQLVEAITQWSELDVTAHELGIEPPSTERRREALRVLVHMCNERPRPYMVYLMENGSISIDARGQRPDGILVALRPDGSAFCTGELGGKTWRKSYSDSAVLPDQDLLEEIAKLG